MLEVGAILVGVWGYEQTNVDFYKVVKVTPKTVSLVKLKAARAEVESMVGYTVPTDEVAGDGVPFRRSVRGGESVKINDYEYAHLWSGAPVMYTSYH